MQGMNGDVLNRDAFETLLPCIFHADEVHDTVRTRLNHPCYVCFESMVLYGQSQEL